MNGSAFNPRVIAAIVAAGIVTFVLFLVLTAYAGDIGTRRDGRGHALSGAAIGFKGIVRLVDLEGGSAWTIHESWEHDAEDLVVAVVEPRTAPEAVRELLERRGARATLIVLPKWDVVGDDQRPGRVRATGLLPGYQVAEMMGAASRIEIRQGRPPTRRAAGTNILSGLSAPLPERVQAVSGPQLQPLLAAGPGAVVLARIGERPHYLLSEPDLLNNHGLRDPDSARAALALLDALNTTDAESVGFDLTLNGFVRQQSPLRLAFDPPFLPLTLALLAAALLAGLHGAFRFGPSAEEARAIAFGKSALVENSASLLRLARREHRAGAAYADLVGEAAAHETGAGHVLRGDELDAYLDRVSPPGGPRFSDLAERAARAESRFDLIAAAQALFQWRKDLIR